MKQTTIQHFKSLSLFSLFVFLCFHLFNMFPPMQATHLALIYWSFYTLCIPFAKENYFFKQLTGLSGAALNLFGWISAVLINLISYQLKPDIYSETTTTAFLYRMLAKPWPYWAIIGLCSLASLYATYVISSHERQKNLFHRIVKTSLTIAGLAIFAYLSYVEFIIVLNVNAINL